MHRGALIAVVLAFMTQGCVAVHSNSTYSRQELGRAATVMGGEIISIRSVKVSGTSSGVGAGAGAVAGGTAGSQVGGSPAANVIGAVGGAVVGGVAGAVAEEAMTQAGATEFIVQQDNGQLMSVVQVDEEGLSEGERVLIIRSGKVRITRDKRTGPGR